MNTATRVDLSAPGVREALERAAEMRLLAVLLERPRAGVRREAADLAREVRDPGLRARAAELEGLEEGAYLAILGPGGPVSPREAAYAGREDPGRLLSDLSGFYNAFGYAPRREDPLDHVAVETGFAAYLWLKEAFARACGEDGAATAQARDRFLSSHLGRLAAGMAARLESIDAPGLRGLVGTLRDRTGKAAVPPGDPPEADEPGSCGGCGLS